MFYYGWKVLHLDSEENFAEGDPAEMVFDGDRDTFWHSLWSAPHPSHPHTLVIGLGAEQEISGVRLNAATGCGCGFRTAFWHLQTASCTGGGGQLFRHGTPASFGFNDYQQSGPARASEPCLYSARFSRRQGGRAADGFHCDNGQSGDDFGQSRCQQTRPFAGHEPREGRAANDARLVKHARAMATDSHRPTNSTASTCLRTQAPHLSN
jgi:hypothetical protein